jgi:hypothetical protein
VHLYPGDGVLVGVESGRPVEHVDSDRVLLDLVRFPREGFGAEIGKQPRQAGRAGKSRRAEDGFQLGAHLIRE